MLSIIKLRQSLFGTSQRIVRMKQFSSNRHATREFEEIKLEINGTGINYVKTGYGDHAVLLLPGAVGSIWTDFKPQIENLSNDRLTVVAWDPPGYGKSRPPDRTFPDNFFQRDARYAHTLMKHLGYDKFSLIGWSDGGITSLLLSSLYPDSIRKMIVIGANAYILPEELIFYQSIRNIDTWSEKMRAPLLAVYGEECCRNIWAAWVDAMMKLYQIGNGDLCKDALSKIKCPTLIVHGAKDAIVNSEHPTYLKEHIKNSRLKIFEKGSHNLHLRYHEEFNTLARTFLLENSSV